VSPAEAGLELREALPAPLRGPLLAPVLEQALGLRAVQRLYQRQRGGDPAPAAFCRRLLADLGVEIELEETGLEALRGLTGPVLVTANHPLGGREALLLNVVLGALRPDYRIVANQIIGLVPEMRRTLILVDPFGGPDAARANVTAMRQAHAWLKAGGLLGLFPAGEVSYWQPAEGRVADKAWAPQCARLARISGATVVPLHFSGRSSAWLRALARVHPGLKTPFLVRELLHGPARRLRARFGRPVPAAALPAGDDAEAAAWLRERCYALGA
jgi:putative hemolysin